MLATIIEDDLNYVLSLVRSSGSFSDTILLSILLSNSNKAFFTSFSTVSHHHIASEIFGVFIISVA